MNIPTLEQMLNAGVHFGHQTLRWNPKMENFILTERNGIHIINLSKTLDCLQKAIEGLQKVLASGRKILFVGTKKSVKHCVEEEAKRCNMFYVTNRWLGGMLTNFSTVKNSIKTLDDIENMESNGILKELKKKEIVSLNKKHAKLNAVLGGIREMNTLPGLIFAVDTKNEHIAVREAIRLNIPIVAIVDSNSNPEDITYPIPGNDDSIKSVSLIVAALTDAIVEFSGDKYQAEAGDDAQEPGAVGLGTADGEKGPESKSEDSVAPPSDEQQPGVKEPKKEEGEAVETPEQKLETTEKAETKVKEQKTEG
ncbi:30S ribosomal protein S2 [Fibrobacterota bacterium]